MLIKEWMEKNGIRVPVLAAQLNVSRQYVWQMCQGSGSKFHQKYIDMIKVKFSKCKYLDELVAKERKKPKTYHRVEKVYFNASETRLLNKYYWVVSKELLSKANSGKYVSKNIYDRTINKLHEEINLCEEIERKRNEA